MRKFKVVKIEDAGRDIGKVFHITEMPASQAERWAMRALLALAKTGVEIPEDAIKTGFAGMAELGINALIAGGLDFVDLEPLMNELMGCVKVIRDPAHPETLAAMIDEDVEIEEIATRLFLRSEVFKLHVSFSPPGAKSTSTPGTTPSQAS